MAASILPTTVRLRCPNCTGIAHSIDIVERGTALQTECVSCGYQLLFSVDLLPQFVRGDPDERMDS